MNPELEFRFYSMYIEELIVGYNNKGKYYFCLPSLDIILFHSAYKENPCNINFLL